MRELFLFQDFIFLFLEELIIEGGTGLESGRDVSVAVPFL